MFIIVDNRFIPSHGSFDLETSVSQHHRLNSVFVGKYITSSQSHPLWSQPILGLIHAKSPERTVLIGGAYITDPIKANSFLEPKFHFRQDHSTWETFLCDAIREISDYIPKVKAINSGSKIQLVILSNHISLGLHSSLTSVRQGVERFVTALNQLRRYYPNIHIRIISVQLLLPTHAPSTEIDQSLFHINSPTTSSSSSFSPCSSSSLFDLSTNHSFHIQSTLSHHDIHFSVITNSSLFYDIELKSLLSSTVPTITSTINIPQVDNMHMKVVVELKPASLSAADCRDIYDLSVGEPFSIVSRSGIAPHMMDGTALWVHAPRTLHHHQQQHQQHMSSTSGNSTSSSSSSSSSSLMNNRLACRSLCRVLAREDTVLVLKFDMAVTGSVAVAGAVGLYDQYWALIPPAAATVPAASGEGSGGGDDGGACYTVSKYASSNGHQNGLVGSCGSGSSSEGEEEEEGCALLVRLVDSDSLLEYDCDYEDTTSAAAAAAPASENMSASASESESREERLLTERYLRRALIAALGPVADYDPAVCPSGRLNCMYEWRMKTPAATVTAPVTAGHRPQSSAAIGGNAYNFTVPPPPQQQQQKQQQSARSTAAPNQQQAASSYHSYNSYHPPITTYGATTATTATSGASVTQSSRRVQQQQQQPLLQSSLSTHTTAAATTAAAASGGGGGGGGSVRSSYQPLQVVTVKANNHHMQQQQSQQQSGTNKRRLSYRERMSNNDNNDNNDDDDDDDEGYLTDDIICAHFPTAATAATTATTATAAAKRGGRGGGRGRNVSKPSATTAAATGDSKRRAATAVVAAARGGGGVVVSDAAMAMTRLGHTNTNTNTSTNNYTPPTNSSSSSSRYEGLTDRSSSGASSSGSGFGFGSGASEGGNRKGGAVLQQSLGSCGVPFEL